MSPDHPAASHPVDLLMDEHEVILQVLQAMERKAFSLPDADGVEAEIWTGFCEFLAGFADRRHHAKEEDLLFPALVSHGMETGQGPIAVMLYEHDQGRGMLQDLRDGIAADDPAAVARAAQSYTFLLREHIQKENMILFEMARGMLSEEEAQRMRAQFDDADRADPVGEWMETASSLCAHGGVEFRPPRPARAPSFEV